MKHLSPFKQARIKSGVSIQEAADSLSIHPTTLLRYERGEWTVPSHVLSQMAALYDTASQELRPCHETGYIWTKGFYLFFCQFSHHPSRTMLFSYFEALTVPEELQLLSYFRLLDSRARHQIMSMTIFLARTQKKGASQNSSRFFRDSVS